MQKMPKCFSSKGLIALSSVFILLSDQVSKFLIVEYIRRGERLFLLPFFDIVRVENKGITFGMFSGSSLPLIWMLLSLIIVVSLGMWARDKKSCWLPVGMIVSGAIGNSIDRVIHGAVIDFLDFHVSTYHWPAFNIADSAIVIGVAVLFFILQKEERL